MALEKYHHTQRPCTEWHLRATDETDESVSGISRIGDLVVRLTVS